VSILLFALMAVAPAGGWFNEPAAKIRQAVDLQDLRKLDSVTGGKYRVSDSGLEYNISGTTTLKMLKGCAGTVVDEPSINTLGHLVWVCRDQPSEINRCMDVGYQVTMEPMKAAYSLSPFLAGTEPRKSDAMVMLNSHLMAGPEPRLHSLR
jgi:hypothetical protein